MQIYANLIKINEKCYFSVISWPILILFVLSDRAWCRLQNFYTELWDSLIMQIYAHLFKINEKCHLSSIQKSQQICTWGGDIYYASRNLLSTCLGREAGEAVAVDNGTCRRELQSMDYFDANDWFICPSTFFFTYHTCIHVFCTMYMYVHVY